MASSIISVTMANIRMAREVITKRLAMKAGVNTVVKTGTNSAKAVIKGGKTTLKGHVSLLFTFFNGIKSILFLFAYFAWLVFSVIVVRLLIESTGHLLLTLNEIVDRQIRHRYQDRKTRLFDGPWPISWVFGIVEFVLSLGVIVVYAFSILSLKNYYKRIIAIFLLVVVGMAMFAFRTHLPGATSTYRETSIAGYESYNTAAKIGSNAIDVNQQLLQFNNVMMYSTVMTMIEVELGAKSVLGYDTGPEPQDKTTDPTKRRALQDAVHGEDKTNGERVFERIMSVITFVWTILMRITIIIINVFFKFIFRVMQLLFGVFEFLAMRLGCLLAGQACGGLEIIDTGVNLFFGWIPGLSIDIACGEDRLKSVSCECRGNLLDYGYFGPFRRKEGCALPSASHAGEYETSRRSLIRCFIDEDGHYVEEYGGQSLHKTENVNSACPTAKRAFHPYTHAVDMERFQTHECLTHCVLGAAFMTCDDTGATLLGSCDDHPMMDEGAAKSKLSFLNVTMNFVPHRDKRRLTSSEQTADQETRVNDLKLAMPLKFSIPGYGDVNLGVVPTDMYQTFDMVRSMLIHQYRTGTAHKDRNLLVVEPIQNNIFSDVAHWIRKHKRAYQSSPLDVYEPHEIVSFADALRYRNAKRRSRRLQENVGVFTEPINPEDSVPCLGKVLCPNQQTCAIEQKYCAPPVEWSPVVSYSYHVQRLGNAMSSFDVGREVMNMKRCYVDREKNPAQNPNTAVNVFRTPEQRLADDRIVYCPGETAPTDWRPQGVAYDPDADIQTVCSGSENFNGCRCPDFWGRTEAVYAGNMDGDGLHILGNGLKFFAYLIWFILNSVARWMDSVLESANLPNFTTFASSNYGLTEHEFMFCVFLHTGDAALTLLFFIILYNLYSSTWFVIQWIEEYYLTENMRNLLKLRKELLANKIKEAKGDVIKRLEMELIQQSSTIDLHAEGDSYVYMRYSQKEAYYATKFKECAYNKYGVEASKIKLMNYDDYRKEPGALHEKDTEGMMYVRIAL